jgi:hypothetical protein
MRRLASVIGPFLGIIVLTGCGDAGNRHAVTGAVTLRGRPLDDGIINFAPLDGQETGDGAQIVAGKYLIPRPKGLAPGRYKVTIYAGDGRSGTGDASPDSPHAGQRPGKERVPPQFNEKSDIVKEVTPDGPNQFDFDIP